MRIFHAIDNQVELRQKDVMSDARMYEFSIFNVY